MYKQGRSWRGFHLRRRMLLANSVVQVHCYEKFVLCCKCKCLISGSFTWGRTTTGGYDWQAIVCEHHSSQGKSSISVMSFVEDLVHRAVTRTSRGMNEGFHSSSDNQTIPYQSHPAMFFSDWHQDIQIIDCSREVFRPGIQIRPEWSGHRSPALSSGLNSTRDRSLRSDHYKLHPAPHGRDRLPSCCPLTCYSFTINQCYSRFSQRQPDKHICKLRLRKNNIFGLCAYEW